MAVRSQIIDIAPHQDVNQAPVENDMEIEKPDLAPPRPDAFGDEETAEVKYKVLKWWCVSELGPFLINWCIKSH